MDTQVKLSGRRCCSRFFCKKQRPGGDDRTVWIPDRGNQLPDDGLQRILFASGWFTALNDGKTSAILSFCRTVIFMIAPVLILPGIFGMDGVWMSITAGEVLSILMSIFYFRKYRNMWSVKV